MPVSVDDARLVDDDLSLALSKGLVAMAVQEESWVVAKDELSEASESAMGPIVGIKTLGMSVFPRRSLP